MPHSKQLNEYDFVSNIPLENTMAFEEVYTGNLQLSLQEKIELKKRGAEFIYLREIESGHLIGETYYIPLDQIQEDLGLEDWKGKNAVYIFGTTILPGYENRGLGTKLKQHCLRELKAKFSLVLGHAREGGSKAINENLGAEILKVEPNWQSSGEAFYLYEIIL